MVIPEWAPVLFLPAFWLGRMPSAAHGTAFVGAERKKERKSIQMSSGRCQFWRQGEESCYNIPQKTALN